MHIIITVYQINHLHILFEHLHSLQQTKSINCLWREYDSEAISRVLVAGQ